MRSNRFLRNEFLISSIVIFLFCQTIYAQAPLTTPRASQYASVTQRIGLTDITITYHSPGVKGRQIWGKLVPYDEVWRAGANENTTISFSDAVSVEGALIPAGTYGLHMIPAKGDWTIIFNKHNSAWGSFFYDKNADVARISVTPQKADFQEWLRYRFEDVSDTSVVAYLAWENLRVPFKIDIDVQQVVLENMRKELRSLPGFNWQAWQQAALYCFQNDINHEEALQWIDRSISLNKNANNVAAKARLLMQTGKTSEAENLFSDAWDLAKQSGNENELNNVGYLYLQTNHTKEAVEIFKLNVKKHPESWNVYDSLGEGYSKHGDVQKAIKNYKIALEKAPELQKKRIRGILEQLQQGG